ncbi:hypothetical protein F4804DRAFT_313473 [Jackrogersella minutella]|nr:hypothetical protein F4804DRAFT_313473 [Jackrogersella minutella]
MSTRSNPSPTMSDSSRESQNSNVSYSLGVYLQSLPTSVAERQAAKQKPATPTESEKTAKAELTVWDYMFDKAAKSRS